MKPLAENFDIKSFQTSICKKWLKWLVTVSDMRIIARTASLLEEPPQIYTLQMPFPFAVRLIQEPKSFIFNWFRN